ncbi:MAG: hypothetical protein Kow0020_14150 [Wenzhouxiangellaceae bacterium]
MIPRDVRRQAGFTLVELMLATALIALIMAMAYGGFRAGLRASLSGDTLIEESNRLRVVHQFVRNQLAQARALVIEQDELQRIVFEGGRDRVRFVAPMPGYLSYGGPYVQELRLERGTHGVDVVYAYAILNGYEPGDLDRDPPVTLLEDVGDAEFSYLGFDESGEEVLWSDEWEQVDRVPLAIRMDLGLARDNGLRWPGLVVPVIIDGGSAGGSINPRSVDQIRLDMLGADPRNGNNRQ